MFNIRKEALLVGLILGIISVISLYIVSEKFQTLRPVNILKQKTSLRNPRSATTLSAIASNPLPSRSGPNFSTKSNQTDNPEPRPTSIWDVCYASWIRVAETRESELLNDLRKRLQFIDRDCLDRMMKQAQAVEIKNYVNLCQHQIADQTLESIEMNCVPSLPRFRAFIIRALRASDDSNLDAYDVSDLANQLVGGMVNLDSAQEADILRNIQIANAMIRNDPNFYGAYKSKLINHLVSEIKFKKPQSSELYRELYDELLSFSGQNQNDTLQAESYAQQGLILPTQELREIDSDLIHIPFLRKAALGDTEGLADLAEEYITSYPNSSIGYVYLADAAWKSGDQAFAVNILKKAMGPSTSDEMIIESLTRFQSQDPLKRIMQMSLGAP